MDNNDNGPLGPQPTVVQHRGRPRKPRNPDGTLVAATGAVQAAPVEPSADRMEMRRPVREEDPRTAAERRAAEIMGHLGGSVDEGTDEFYIDPRAIPDGWTYEWKRKTIYGSEDPSYSVSLKRTGWTEVPASRHPEMMPANYKSAAIERKGLVLMERPTIVTEQVEMMDRRRAKDQIRAKEQQLSHAPDGQFGRDHAQAQPKIKKSYEAMPIPKE